MQALAESHVAVFLVGLLLSYCLVYLLARLFNEKPRWAGFICFACLGPPGFIVLVLIVNAPMGALGYLIHVIGVVLSVGLVARLTSKPKVARSGSFVLSYIVGFVIPSIVWAKMLNVSMPPGGIDCAVGHYATTMMAGAVGVVAAMVGRLRPS